MKYLLSVTVTVLLTAFSVHSASAQVSTLTNTDIVRYVTAMHMPDQATINLINEAKAANATQFDLSPAAVADLKAHGVSPAVIAAMGRPAPTPPATTRRPSAPVPLPTNGMSPIQSAGNGAQKAPGSQVLPAALDMVAMMDKNYWSLAIQFSKPDYQAKNAQQTVGDVDLFAASEETDQQHTFVKKYRTELDGAIGSLGLVGVELGQFVYLKNNLPVIFAWKGESLAVVITGIATSTVYNTIQLTGC